MPAKTPFRICSLVMVLLAGSVAVCAQSGGNIILNDKEYFEAPGFAFLVFHNNYPGLQGGLQMFQYGERLLDSGGLTIAAKDRSARSGVRILRRTVDREHATATAFGDVEGLGLGYQVICRSGGDRIFVTVKLDKPVDWSKVDQAGFRISLYSGAYYSKSFQGESATGVFPQQFSGKPVLLDSTRVIRVAQEDPSRSIKFERRNGTLKLTDGRGRSPQPWFSVVAPIETGSAATEVQLEITPSIDPNWRRAPVIGVAQVGYHPTQPKQAVLELDPRDASADSVRLYKLGIADRQVVKSEKPKPWGRFLHYQYAVFDFSEVREPGVYMLEYGGQKAGPFRIDAQIYDQAWRPTLEVFLPVQMCHVAVREGSRTWHGPCHIDDALQAPENKVHIDGYRQGARETRFADNEHIPGLDWGGWHDAGDHDLPAGSIANTTIALALAQEEFKPQDDQTTVRREDRQVLLYAPDGKQDLLQQIEYGVEGLLASYRIAGWIFPGIIESTGLQYGHTGDPVNITDNRIYDKAGRQDDRWAFTNRNTGLDYEAVQTLAIASRVLGDQNPKLASECLDSARKLWDYEQSHPPAYAPNAYVPRDTGFRSHEISATAELLITTGEARYRERLAALLPQIKAITPEQFGSGPGWTLVRLLPKSADPELRSIVMDLSKKWKDAETKMTASNPYGVPLPAGVSNPEWKFDNPRQANSPHIWGPGWNLQTAAMHHYYFQKHLPDVFDRNSLLSTVNFVLGNHPATNESYVSGVGARSPLIAYGINRSDFSHIPGGVISGASLIRPDFMELKTFPFLYYQTEYVIHGAGTYIFDVLAADKLLNGAKEGL